MSRGLHALLLLYLLILHHLSPLSLHCRSSKYLCCSPDGISTYMEESGLPEEFTHGVRTTECGLFRGVLSLLNRACRDRRATCSRDHRRLATASCYLSLVEVVGLVLSYLK